MKNVEVKKKSNVEVEVRSFISEDDYNRFIKFFRENAEYLGEDEQATYYLSGKDDIRLQQNSSCSKIWMKKGKIHDEHREEMEVRCKREDFDKLMKIFETVGYSIEIKWFRRRHTFRWGGISVMLDNTKGYGHIIELEMMADDESKSGTYRMLKSKLESLDIKITPRPEFDRKFKHYKKNWKRLVS